MIKTFISFAVMLAVTGCVTAGEKPSNMLYDASRPNHTIWPKPIKHSGELSWKDHRQDLSRWVTLSYSDKRDASHPKKTDFKGNLNGDPKKGKELAFNKKKGNCVACHVLPGNTQFGTVGPSLVMVSYKNRDNGWLYQQLYDARVHNPDTVMPPYGTHGVLSDQELRDIASYIKSL